MKLSFFFIQTILLKNQKYDIDSFWKNHDSFGFYDTHGNIKQFFPKEKDIINNVPNIMNYQNFDEKSILNYKDKTIIFEREFKKKNIKLFTKWNDMTVYETILNDSYYRFGSRDCFKSYKLSSQEIFEIPTKIYNCQKIACKDDLIFSMNHDNIFTIHNFTNDNFLFEIPFQENSIVEKMEIKKYNVFIHCCLKFLNKNEIFFIIFQYLDKTSRQIVMKRFQKICVNENIIDFDFDKDNLIVASKFLIHQYKIHFLAGISKNQMYRNYFEKSFFFSKICLFDNVLFFNGSKKLRFLEID